MFLGERTQALIDGGNEPFQIEAFVIGAWCKNTQMNLLGLKQRAFFGVIFAKMNPGKDLEDAV